MTRRTLLLSAACMLVVFSGCSGAFHPWDETWYSAHPMTTEQLIETMGAPKRITQLEDGREEWLYAGVGWNNNAFYPYYDVVNDMVVESGVR